MKDYTKDIEFWKRLQSFVSDVQTNCCMGEEEKQMIIHNCKLKILDIQRVSVSVASSDVGKCTKCKFNINDRCTVGTYYAEQGKSRFCIEGELWEANER